MPINRLYTPAQIPTVQPFVLPYEQIGQGLLAAQGQQDAATGLLDEIGNITFNYNDKDKDLANAQYAEIDKFQEDLLGRSGNGDLRKLTGDIKSYARNIASKFRPNNVIGALQADYNARTKFIDEVTSNKDISGTMKQAAINYYDEINPGVTKAGTGYVRGYSSEPLSKEVSIPAKYEEYVDGIMASSGITVRETADGVGYFRQTKYGIEEVPFEQVKAVIEGYKNSDNEYQASRNQFVKYGIYDEPTMQAIENQALYAAINKHAYRKVTDEQTMSADSTALWWLDKQMEEEKENEFGSSQELLAQNPEEPFNLNNELGLADGLDLNFGYDDNLQPPTLLPMPAGMDMKQYENTVLAGYDKQMEAYKKQQETVNQIRQLNPNYNGLSDRDVIEEHTNAVNNYNSSFNNINFYSKSDNDNVDKIVSQSRERLIDNMGILQSNVTYRNKKGEIVTQNVSVALKELGVLNDKGKVKDDVVNLLNLPSNSIKDYIQNNAVIRGVNGSDPKRAGDLNGTLIDDKGRKQEVMIENDGKVKAAFTKVREVVAKSLDPDFHKKIITNPDAGKLGSYKDVDGTIYEDYVKAKYVNGKYITYYETIKKPINGKSISVVKTIEQLQNESMLQGF
jgi:hypothetical protein